MKKIFKIYSLLILAVFFSCGVKGSPKIPPSTIPEPVKDIKIKQQGDTIVVFWKYNPVYEDGRKIKEPFLFKIEENDKEIKPVIKNIKNLYWFIKKIPSFEEEFCYRIKVITKKGYMSTSKYFCYLPVKDFPIINADIFLKLKNEGILIIWDKKYINNVLLYKGEKKDLIPPIPYKKINKSNMFLDKEVQINKRYCYFITVEDREKVVESNPSEIKCIIYKDIFPPEPVKNPSFVIYKGKLFIFWDESPSKDVIGYIIEKNDIPLNEKPVYTYFFVIDKFQKGDIIKIYAVDKAGNKSSPVYLKVE